MSKVQELYDYLKNGELTSVSGLQVEGLTIQRLKEWLSNKVNLDSDNPTIFGDIPQLSDETLEKVAGEMIGILEYMENVDPNDSNVTQLL